MNRADNTGIDAFHELIREISSGIREAVQAVNRRNQIEQQKLACLNRIETILRSKR